MAGGRWVTRFTRAGAGGASYHFIGVQIVEARVFADLEDGVPAETVNRVCGSGLQAIVSAAQSIMLGEGSSYVAGGVEAMSGVPFQLPGARYGWRPGAGRGDRPAGGRELFERGCLVQVLAGHVAKEVLDAAAAVGMISICVVPGAPAITVADLERERRGTRRDGDAIDVRRVHAVR